MCPFDKLLPYFHYIAYVELLVKNLKDSQKWPVDMLENLICKTQSQKDRAYNWFEKIMPNIWAKVCKEDRMKFITTIQEQRTDLCIFPTFEQKQFMPMIRLFGRKSYKMRLDLTVTSGTNRNTRYKKVCFNKSCLNPWHFEIIFPKKPQSTKNKESGKLITKADKTSCKKFTKDDDFSRLLKLKKWQQIEETKALHQESSSNWNETDARLWPTHNEKLYELTGNVNFLDYAKETNAEKDLADGINNLEETKKLNKEQILEESKKIAFSQNLAKEEPNAANLETTETMRKKQLQLEEIEQLKYYENLGHNVEYNFIWPYGPEAGKPLNECSRTPEDAYEDWLEATIECNQRNRMLDIFSPYEPNCDVVAEDQNYFTEFDGRNYSSEIGDATKKAIEAESDDSGVLSIEDSQLEFTTLIGQAIKMSVKIE